MENKIVNKFWEIRNSANTSVPELILYGDISSSSWWGDEVTPKQFSEDLQALGSVDEIIVRINSGGGDVFAANAIYSRLKDHKAKITVKIDGWAASAATIIAMAGDSIEIPANGIFMVHDPKMFTWDYYSSDELIKMADELDVIKNSIVKAYAIKTGLDEDEIAEIMSNETWYTGSEAVEKGFCDSIMFDEVNSNAIDSSKVVVNSIEMNISKYKNFNTKVLNNQPKAHNKDDFQNKSNSNQEGERNMPDIKDVAMLRQTYPDLISQIESEAVDSERKRIQAIDEITVDGFEDAANKAKFVEPINSSEFAVQMIKQQKAQGKKFLNEREEDIDESGVDKVETDKVDEGSKKSEKNEYVDYINKCFPETK